MMSLSGFAKYAWCVLAYNIVVILWGAYVRATGSGAGCGSHWPLCNGVVIPIEPQIETIIEFTHRLSSGVSLLLVVGLFFWAFRAFPKGHIVRTGAKLSLFFIVTEAIVGAGLVLFEWVALNDSIERVVSMSVHLINTFLLLAALTLTAWWASGGKRVDPGRGGGLRWLFAIGIISVLILGITGAITALGDTLFPAGTLVEGIAQDLSPTAHFLVRLRVWHPLIAILSATYIIVLTVLTGLLREDRKLRRIATVLSTLFVVQLIAGLVNLVLLAPVAMQLIHLLLADLIWISLVLMSALTFERGESPVVEASLAAGVQKYSKAQAN
jgi:heme A synthase